MLPVDGDVYTILLMVEFAGFSGSDGFCGAWRFSTLPPGGAVGSCGCVGSLGFIWVICVCCTLPIPLTIHFLLEDEIQSDGYLMWKYTG